MWTRVNTRVMNDCIHLPDLIDLAGEVSRLHEVGKIRDCREGSVIDKVLHGGQPSLGANMDNDLVPVSEQRFSRSMSKPVSGAGDEDTSLLVGVRRRRCRSLFLSRIKRGLRDGRCGWHKGTRDYPKAYSQATRRKPRWRGKFFGAEVSSFTPVRK